MVSPIVEVIGVRLGVLGHWYIGIAYTAAPRFDLPPVEVQIEHLPNTVLFGRREG